MKVSSLLLALCALLAPLMASADVPPSGASECRGRKAGDRCTTESGREGQCKALRCSGLDYSRGTPPGTREYDCLLCRSSADAR